MSALDLSPALRFLPAWTCLALAACGPNTGNIAGTPPGAGNGLSCSTAGSGGEVEGSPLMLPGQNCLCCHSFTAAGTVFTASGAAAGGVTVSIGGLTLTTNAAGNFYTTSPIAFPATVTVENGSAARPMPFLAPSGACNSCHGAGGTPPIASP